MRVSSTLHLIRSFRRPVVGLAALALLGLALIGSLMALPGAGLAAQTTKPTDHLPDYQLVMVEQHGCIYCARWNEEVAPEYGLTPEGRFAPLRRVDLRDLPADLSFERRVVFTPTFVLMGDGTEIGRLEGYPGEDFFWGLLGRLLSQATPDWAMATQGGTR